MNHQHAGDGWSRGVIGPGAYRHRWLSTGSRLLRSLSGTTAVLSPFFQFNCQTATIFGHAFAFPRRKSPEFCIDPLAQSEGAGNAGRSMRPQPRVQDRKTHELVTTVTPETPGIPRAMVLTVSFVLSLVTGLFATIPANAKPRRRVDASVGASGPHDFAVRKTALSSAAQLTSTWGNRGSELPLNRSQPTMEAGGCSPIGWKYGLTTGRRAQTSNGEQPWKNISVSTCR